MWPTCGSYGGIGSKNQDDDNSFFGSDNDDMPLPIHCLLDDDDGEFRDNNEDTDIIILTT